MQENLFIMSFVFICNFHFIDCCTGYAPPFTYGPKSKSHTALAGRNGLKKCYSVEQKNNVGTLLCCEAKGYRGSAEYWQNIGCSNNQAVKGCADWGNNFAYPEVRCYGNPFGTGYTWNC